MWWCRASPSWWGASLYSRCAQLQRASTAAQAWLRRRNAQARQRRPAADRQAGGRGRPRHSRPRTAGLAPRPAAPVWPADDHGRCGQLWHRGAQAEVAGLRGRGAHACSTADDARCCCGLVLLCRMQAPPPHPTPSPTPFVLLGSRRRRSCRMSSGASSPPGELAERLSCRRLSRCSRRPGSNSSSMAASLRSSGAPTPRSRHHGAPSRGRKRGERCDLGSRWAGPEDGSPGTLGALATARWWLSQRALSMSAVPLPLSSPHTHTFSRPTACLPARSSYPADARRSEEAGGSGYGAPWAYSSGEADAEFVVADYYPTSTSPYYPTASSSPSVAADQPEGQQPPDEGGPYELGGGGVEPGTGEAPTQPQGQGQQRRPRAGGFAGGTEDWD